MNDPLSTERRLSPLPGEHSPRPWVQPVRYDPSSGRDLPCGAISTRDGRIVACLEGFSLREWAANAALICAAPALLDLARQYASECANCDGTGKATGFDADAGPSPGDDCVACAHIREIIAKAAGENRDR